MKARTRVVLNEDGEQARQARAERDLATEPSERARRFLEAVRAVSPFAVRMLAEGVTGRDSGARAEAMTFLLSRYFPDDAEDPNDHEEAALALGVSVGLRLRVDASDLEGARASLSLLGGDQIAATAEKSVATRRRTMRVWKCDQPRRGARP